MKERLWTKEYGLAVTELLFCHMGPYLLLSVISLFAKELTGSNTYAGMMASVFALSGLFARFISAPLLEKIGNKKTMLLSVCILMIASFAYIFINTFMMAFILRGIQGFGYGIAVTAISTYLVKIVHPDRLVEGIGYSSLTGSLCGVVGPTLAYTIIGSQYDRFQSLFIIVFGCTMIAFVLAFFLKDLKPETKSESSKHTVHEAIRWSLLIGPVLIHFVSTVANSSISSFLSMYAIDRGFENIGLSFSINAIGLFLSRFTMSRLISWLGENKTILLITCMIALSLFSISIVSQMWQLLITGFFLGYGVGALTPLVNARVVSVMPVAKAGLANAIFFATGDVGFIIGSTFWGFVANHVTYGQMYRIAGIGCLFAIVTALLQLKNGADS